MLQMSESKIEIMAKLCKFQDVNLTYRLIYLAKILPRGIKSIPRDKSISDCCQNVLKIFGAALPSVLTSTEATETDS